MKQELWKTGNEKNIAIFRECDSQRNLPISGTVVQEHAKEQSKKLGGKVNLRRLRDG